MCACSILCLAASTVLDGVVRFSIGCCLVEVRAVIGSLALLGGASLAAGVVGCCGCCCLLVGCCCFFRVLAPDVVDGSYVLVAVVAGASFIVDFWLAVAVGVECWRWWWWWPSLARLHLLLLAWRLSACNGLFAGLLA